MKYAFILRYVMVRRWETIFENFFNVNNLFNCGTEYIQFSLDTCNKKNNFWKDTLNSWKLTARIHVNVNKTEQNA